MQTPSDISDGDAMSQQGDQFVLEHEPAGAGSRWTLPSDGVSIARASRIVGIFAGILFIGGTSVLFLAGVVDNDTVVRLLSTAWITAIILALAAAHWRSIAGEPTVLEVQPDGIVLQNPAFLLGRTRRWRTGRIRKFVIAHRGKDLGSGRQVGNLYVYFRVRSCALFNGLEIAELQNVAERIHEITSIKVVK